MALEFDYALPTYKLDHSAAVHNVQPMSCPPPALWHSWTWSRPHCVESSAARAKRRATANARERVRMNDMNQAFDTLRDLIPNYPAGRKLSKIDTLRLAKAYIKDLADLLRDENIRVGYDVSLSGATREVRRALQSSELDFADFLSNVSHPHNVKKMAAILPCNFQVDHNSP